MSSVLSSQCPKLWGLRVGKSLEFTLNLEKWVELFLRSSSKFCCFLKIKSDMTGFIEGVPRSSNTCAHVPQGAHALKKTLGDSQRNHSHHTWTFAGLDGLVATQSLAAFPKGWRAALGIGAKTQLPFSSPMLCSLLFGALNLLLKRLHLVPPRAQAPLLHNVVGGTMEPTQERSQCSSRTRPNATGDGSVRQSVTRNWWVAMGHPRTSPVMVIFRRESTFAVGPMVLKCPQKRASPTC